MFKRLFEFNSIRSRMVSGFLFLTFLLLLLAAVSLFIIEQINKGAQMNGAMNHLESQTLTLIKSDNTFFDQETTNQEYFSARKSIFLARHDSLMQNILSEIRSFTQSEENINIEIYNRLIAIDSTLIHYDNRFRKLEALMFKRGFKDYGVEGAMRYHAHALEEMTTGKDLLAILFLRRHEKDFLLRNDKSYISLFSQRSAQLITKLRSQEPQNTDAIKHLETYQLLFIELAAIQRTLGFTGKEGLRLESNVLADALSSQYEDLSALSHQQSRDAYHDLRIFYIALLAGALLFSIVSAYWISKRLSAPITRLSKIMQDAVVLGNTMEVDLRLNNAAIEISSLASAFNLLLSQAKMQMTRAKMKSNLLKQKNRELKKLNRELDNFLYSTAHDLRSPLTSLLGLTNIIRHENEQPQLLEHIDMMEKSIQRSEHFIAQIVGYSKNKRMEAHIEKVDMETLINHIMEDHQFAPGADRISKHITINDTIPLFADRNRIIILITNLVSNAIKYADFTKADPFIRILLNISESHFTIEFSDNGLGIPKEHLPNIFKMFYRAHETSKGSGLGLFIFKETIVRMNGTVRVTSEVGTGTTFHISIPNLYARMSEQIEEALTYHP